MPPLTLTEADIQAQATPKVFPRGVDYYRSGMVLSLVRRGEVLYAEVEGSELDPYLVRVELEGAAVRAAGCTCPYEWGGWCKHTVAVLLACLYKPGRVEERPPLGATLGELGEEQLRALLHHLAAHDSRLTDEIERWAEAHSGEAHSGEDDA